MGFVLASSYFPASAADTSFDNSVVKNSSPTKFYCCGTVPPVGIYRKRHGMFEGNSFEKELPEFAVEALENDSQGFTRIVEPRVPYVGEIPEQLYLGRAIEIHGKVLENANKFTVNLSTGSQSNADICLHFNPRFDRRIVVRNHRVKKEWGQEEIATVNPFPFKFGRSFSMLIFIADQQFMITINQIHFCTFSFRMSLDRIRHLIVTGDILLKLICHCDLTFYPPLLFTKMPFVVIPRTLKQSGHKCLIKRKVHEISSGTRIDMIGRLKVLPCAFYINLQSDSNLWPHPVIPFHMNLRYNQPGEKKYEQEVIFNTWENGDWGKEEMISHSPFEPGTAFFLSISYLEKTYRVHVNDRLFYEYRRRSRTEVNSLVVHGDVIVTKILFR